MKIHMRKKKFQGKAASSAPLPTNLETPSPSLGLSENILATAAVHIEKSQRGKDIHPTQPSTNMDGNRSMDETLDEATRILMQDPHRRRSKTDIMDEARMILEVWENAAL